MTHEWVFTVGAGLSDPTGLFETQMKAGQGLTALYLNALSPDDVFRATAAGEVMPQKSTFFHPKLPTGLVFRLCDEA